MINFVYAFNHVGVRGRLALSAALEVKKSAPDFLKFWISNVTNALYPRHYKVVCVPTFKHEMYSYLHEEYRATAARGKRDLSFQVLEERSAAHAHAHGAVSCEA
jgi:hypothetical protein